MPDSEEHPRPIAPQDHPTGSSSGDELPQEPLIEILSSLSVDLGKGAKRAPDLPRQVVFTVEHDAAYHMAYRVSGARAERGICNNRWSVDFGSLNLQLRDMGRFLAASHQDQDEARREVWRRAAQQLGCHMYDGLLAVDGKLAAALKRLQRWTLPSERLTLAFAGPESFLGVPYELLVESATGEALALHHPLCRQVTGVPVGDGLTWRDWVMDMQQGGETLRVLLISSGAEQIGATDEISALEAVFDTVSARTGQRVAVDLMLAGDAGPEHIRARLQACPYHIVHYAGQIYHDERHSEQSGLLFSARHEAQLGQVVVNGVELSALLAGSATRLVYLSAGIERVELDAPALRTGDDFDVLREVVNAGVPYAVGLRWYAAPAMRQQLAAQFYTHLLAEPFVPEIALLRARQKAAQANIDDESWTAPVLVARNIYLGGN